MALKIERIILQGFEKMSLKFLKLNFKTERIKMGFIYISHRMFENKINKLIFASGFLTIKKKKGMVLPLF